MTTIHTAAMKTAEFRLLVTAQPPPTTLSLGTATQTLPVMVTESKIAPTSVKSFGMTPQLSSVPAPYEVPSLPT